MTVQDAFDEFIMYKTSYARPGTLLAYETELKPFIKYIGKKTPVADLTQAKIVQYQISLQKRKLRPATVASYTRGAKVFLRYCRDDAGIEMPGVRIEKIKTPKLYQKDVPIYTAEQIRQIFDVCKAESEWLTVRNKSILALMYDSGLRQNEVATLRSDRVSFEDRMLIVTGKGGKDRIVPLGKYSAEFLQEYIALCPYRGKFVFWNRRGEPMTNNAIKQYVYKIYRQVSFPLSSHMLRHNFATNYCLNQLEKTGVCDIYALAVVMGHEEIKTTMNYLHHAEQIHASKHIDSQLDKVLVSRFQSP